MLVTSVKIENNIDLYVIFMDYLWEVFEVFISLLILKVLIIYTKNPDIKNLNIMYLLQYSFFIAMFTLVLEYILPNVKGYIKPMIINLFSSM